MKQTVNVIEDIPTAITKEEKIICNRCGKEALLVQDGNEVHDGKPAGREYLHVEYSGGFDNWVVGDGGMIDFDLCQHCVDELIKGFVFKPEVGCYIHGNMRTWDEMVAQRDEWRD